MACVDCRVPFCGDGIVNPDLGEECDEGTAMPSTTCRNCKKPTCGDGIIDEFLGESCDPPGALADPNNQYSMCREDCTFCGDKMKNGNEECDGTEFCRPDCTECICEAVGRYDDQTGGVIIDFNYCDEEEPREDDFLAVYPCDADELLLADQDWFDATCESPQLALTPYCQQYLLELGFVEGEIYNMDPMKLQSFTCGNPGNPCSNSNVNTIWPTEGQVEINPSMRSEARWAFPLSGPAGLQPGCYKVLMQRDVSKAISAPPHPTICKDWYNANEFIVPQNSFSEMGGR